MSMSSIETVTLSTPGREPVTVTGEQFEQVAERLHRQLSFDVGGQKPSNIKLSFSGTLSIDRQLLKGQELVLHILDQDGEIIADAHGTVVAVAFVDKRDKDGFVTTTREQKVALDS
jgi:hypothetical protein